MLNDCLRTRWTAVITVEDPNEASLRAVACLPRDGGPDILGVGEATLSSEDTGGEAAEDLAMARALRDVAVQLTIARPLSTPVRRCPVAESDILRRTAVLVGVGPDRFRWWAGLAPLGTPVGGGCC
jgi:hypothetical protein